MTKNRLQIIVGLVVFLLYALTQAPGLYYTDTGELAAACKTWGVAHPTGYPLFTLLGHVWLMLPWTSAIKGLNILVALLVSASASLMVPLTIRILSSAIKDVNNNTAKVVGVCTALVFAFGTVVWGQTTAVEVYALNLLLLVFTLNAITIAIKNTDQFSRYTVIAGLGFGLMLANHISSVFLLPGLFFLWWKGNSNSSPNLSSSIWLFAPMLLGVSMYALLPLRSASMPPINWGMVHRGWDEFLYHVKGTQFGVWLFSDAKAFKVNASLFTSIVTTDFAWIGWILIPIGIVLMFSRSKFVAIGFLLMIAGNLGISFGYSIHDIDSYFIPSLTILTLFFGVGLYKIASMLKGQAVYSVCVIPLLALVLNFGHMDNSKHEAVEAYTRWTMSNVQPNAIVITRQWDFMCSAMWYLQTVEGFRTDVAVIDKELLRRTWYPTFLTQRYPTVMAGAQREIDEYMPWLTMFERDADAFMVDPKNPQEIQRRFVALLNAVITNNANRPVYITPEIWNEEKDFAKGYMLIPVGPLLRITKDSTVVQKTLLDGVDLVTSSLRARTTRLDSALSQTVLGALYSDAMFTLESRRDTAGFREIVEKAVALNPRSRIARTLQDRLQ